MTSLADRAHVLRTVRCLSRSAAISNTRIIRYSTRYSASPGAAKGISTCTGFTECRLFGSSTATLKYRACDLSRSEDGSTEPCSQDLRFASTKARVLRRDKDRAKTQEDRDVEL